MAPLLPFGAGIRDYSASALGVDAQWSGGPWSTEGEWQHFRFEMPGFLASPSEDAAYGQVKCILSPRAFVAARITALRVGRVHDASGVAASRYQAPREIDEVSFGYRLNRQQLLKIGLNWTNLGAWSAANWYWPESHGYGVQLQLVTTFTALSRAFR